MSWRLSIPVVVGLFAFASVAEAAPRYVRQGGRTGIGIGGGTEITGLSLKYWFMDRMAFQVVGGVWGITPPRSNELLEYPGGSLDGLYESPNIIDSDVAVFGISLGAGGFFAYGGQGDEWAGAHGVIGLELAFVPVAMDIVAEYRPGLLFYPDIEADLVNFAGHVRFYF